MKQSFVGGGKMGESADEREPLVVQASVLPRFSMIAGRWVAVLAVVLGVATIAYFSVQDRLVLSSASKGVDHARAFFIFGDSYADVGNIPDGQANEYPYGTTWPGYPTGRFSDGHIQPDYLAMQIPGCESPPAFANSNVKTLFQGANFAVGGAGMTYAYGAPTMGTQVSWFEAIVQSGVYTKEFLASSVTLFCASGNDYATYQGDLEKYVAFIEEIVGMISESLQNLYNLGLRNIMVTTLSPMDCLPASTVFTNYTSCAYNAMVEDVEIRHNMYLETTLTSLSKDLPGVNFVLLRQGDALKEIQNNNILYNISEPLRPCCSGFCGGVGQTGNLLYTLCENPENYVLWDDVHPTQAAWDNVVKLYVNDEAYTTFAPTLLHWTENLP
ncbi:unnamed protein product [Calypogeia fissa]